MAGNSDSIDKRSIFLAARNHGSPNDSLQDWTTAVNTALYLAAKPFFKAKGQKLVQEHFVSSTYVEKFVTSFVTSTRRMWVHRSIRRDQLKLLNVKKHASFFQKQFYFESVDIVDPLANRGLSVEQYRVNIALTNLFFQNLACI